MYGRRTLTIGLLIFLSSFFVSCGKITQDQVDAIQSGDVLSVMRSAIQLPLPDNSYASKTASNQPSEKSNIRTLVNAVDTVASALRESNNHFGQMLDEGSHQNGNLHIIDLAIATDLSGTRDDGKGQIKWVYMLESRQYFSGTEATSGTQGDLLFDDSETQLHWDFSASGSTTKNITVRQGLNLLTLTISYSSGSQSTTLAGHLGSLEISGKWDSSGGFYQEGKSKFCWDAQLVNATCKN